MRWMCDLCIALVIWVQIINGVKLHHKFSLSNCHLALYFLNIYVLNNLKFTEDIENFFALQKCTDFFGCLACLRTAKTGLREDLTGNLLSDHEITH